MSTHFVYTLTQRMTKLMKNCSKFNMDLNAKCILGETAFHRACRYGRTSIVELLINNSEAIKLDLTAKDNYGRTGFQLAKQWGMTAAVYVIRSKIPNIV